VADEKRYSAPRARLSDAEPLLRNRWVAVVLGLLMPAIAMLYVARPLRAIAYLGAALLAFPTALLLGARGVIDPNVFSGLAGVLLSVVAAVDAYRLAKVWRGVSVPWYARAPALISFFVAGWLSMASLRAFVAEPFRIPSSAMVPTLQIGDHILVSKTSYGWNVPFSGRRIARFGAPARGDVAVFRYPVDRDLQYVMRVVGLPGDTIGYTNKKLSVNGKVQPLRELGPESITDSQGVRMTLTRHEESLENVRHAILLDPDVRPYEPAAVRQFEGRESCWYENAGFVCKVPADHYFVMGDNRDNSSDSRYWGFVPADDFVGRVFLIWYSERNPERAGAAVD
jgi:signal peptidase I